MSASHVKPIALTTCLLLTSIQLTACGQGTMTIDSFVQGSHADTQPPQDSSIDNPTDSEHPFGSEDSPHQENDTQNTDSDTSYQPTDVPPVTVPTGEDVVEHGGNFYRYYHPVSDTSALNQSDLLEHFAQNIAPYINGTASGFDSEDACINCHSVAKKQADIGGYFLPTDSNQASGQSDSPEMKHNYWNFLIQGHLNFEAPPATSTVLAKLRGRDQSDGGFYGSHHMSTEFVVGGTGSDIYEKFSQWIELERTARTNDTLGSYNASQFMCWIQRYQDDFHGSRLNGKRNDQTLLTEIVSQGRPAPALMCGALNSAGDDFETVYNISEMPQGLTFEGTVDLQSLVPSNEIKNNQLRLFSAMRAKPEAGYNYNLIEIKIQLSANQTDIVSADWDYVVPATDRMRNVYNIRTEERCWDKGQNSIKCHGRSDKVLIPDAFPEYFSHGRLIYRSNVIDPQYESNAPTHPWPDDPTQQDPVFKFPDQGPIPNMVDAYHGHDPTTQLYQIEIDGVAQSDRKSLVFYPQNGIFMRDAIEARNGTWRTHGWFLSRGDGAWEEQFKPNWDGPASTNMPSFFGKSSRGKQDFFGQGAIDSMGRFIHEVGARGAGSSHDLALLMTTHTYGMDLQSSDFSTRPDSQIWVQHGTTPENGYGSGGQFAQYCNGSQSNHNVDWVDRQPNAGFQCPFCQTFRVIQYYFITTYLNQHWGKAFQIRIYWGYLRIFNIVVSDI